MEKIELGDRVRNRIDGFEGIATGISDYLQQCRQVLVTPEELKADGEQRPARWLDEPWLVVVESGVHAPRAAVEVDGKRVSGGPERPVGRTQPHP